MTKELFEKACKLNKDIEKCKKVLKAYNSPSENVIRCNSFDGERDTRETIFLSNEPELEMKIREYLMHKLDALEQKFKTLM